MPINGLLIVEQVFYFICTNIYYFGINSKFQNWLDFKELSVIDIELGDKFLVQKIEKITVNSAISENLETKKIVDFYLSIARIK